MDIYISKEGKKELEILGEKEKRKQHEKHSPEKAEQKRQKNKIMKWGISLVNGKCRCLAIIKSGSQNLVDGNGVAKKNEGRLSKKTKIQK